MLLAIVVTLAQCRHHELVGWIAIAMAIGGGFGAVGARRVKMTAMPQMVALFNGVGGGAAALIALAEFHNLAPASGRLELNISVAIDRALGAHRLDLVRGLDDRLRQAAGADRRAADRLSGAEARERARGRDGRRRDRR